jgi:hypothetical protein
VAFASSTTGDGTAAFVPLPAWQASVPANTVNIIATIRTDPLDIIPPTAIPAIPCIRVTSLEEVSDVLVTTDVGTAALGCSAQAVNSHPMRE